MQEKNLGNSKSKEKALYLPICFTAAYKTHVADFCSSSLF